MPQPYTRGPVLIYAGVGGSSGPLYLGTGERAPRVSRLREFEPVMNDLAGTRVPFDMLAEGQQALITVKLTRWDDAVLQAVEARSSAAPAGGIAGPGSTGALMIAEGWAFPLWLLYSYGPQGPAAKAAMGTLRPGFHFFATWLEGPQDGEGGTDPATELLVFHAIEVYTGGTMSLYDYNLAGLPAPT